MFSNELQIQASQLLAACRAKGLRIATAESCTGGLLSALLTDIPGSSDVFERGFVTYANEAKTEMLGVPDTLLAEQGAVSEPVAKAMAEGALAHSTAQLSVGITGVAGPGGGTAEKPVGLVYVACAFKGHDTQIRKLLLDGDRQEIRMAAVNEAIQLMEMKLDRN